MRAMVAQIKKRNGEIVDFDARKIKEAMHKANIAVADEKIPVKTLKELTERVVNAIPADTVPTVEQIQDMVEETLIGAILPRPPRPISSTARSTQKSARAKRI